MSEEKEIANFEETTVSDIESYDIPKTIVGSVVGFFVWYYLNKLYPSQPPSASIPVPAQVPVQEQRPDMNVNDSARVKRDIIIGW